MRASHLSGQIQNGLKPSPYTSRKREQNGLYRRNVLSFSVSEVFAAAKVKLLCSEVFAAAKVKLLCSEVCATHK